MSDRIHSPSSGWLDDILLPFSPPKVGDKVGPYVLAEELGSGAYGKVFRAVQPETGRIVAIKVPHFGIDFSRIDLGLHERLGDSVAAVCKIKDVPDGSGCIVMEYCPGPTLRDVLVELATAKRKLPSKALLRLAKALLRAVADIHREDVYHYDLKPGNIVVSTQRRVRRDSAETGGRETAGDVVEHLARGKKPRIHILDLGLAGVSAPTIEEGTLRYRPPESFAPGSKSLGRWDVFSLGVILHELLFGRPPSCVRPEEGLQRPDLRALPACGPVWDYCLRRSLSSDPSLRFPDARRMLVALSPIAPVRRVVDWRSFGLSFLPAIILGGAICGISVSFHNINLGMLALITLLIISSRLYEFLSNRSRANEGYFRIDTGEIITPFESQFSRSPILTVLTAALIYQLFENVCGFALGQLSPIDSSKPISGADIDNMAVAMQAYRAVIIPYVAYYVTLRSTRHALLHIYAAVFISHLTSLVGQYLIFPYATGNAFADYSFWQSVLIIGSFQAGLLICALPLVLMGWWIGKRRRHEFLLLRGFRLLPKKDKNTLIEIASKVFVDSRRVSKDNKV